MIYLLFFRVPGCLGAVRTITRRQSFIASFFFFAQNSLLDLRLRTLFSSR